MKILERNKLNGDDLIKIEYGDEIFERWEIISSMNGLF